MVMKYQNCTCLSGIVLDSIVKVGKICYLQIHLEEYNYAIKQKNTMNAINEELNLDASDDNESDEEKNEN